MVSADYSAIQLERTVNYLIKELHANMPAALAEIDSRMEDEDTVMAEIMGSYYGPQPTPPPSTYRMGHLPTLDTLNMEDYPYITCWADNIDPRSDEGAYSEGVARLLIECFLAAGDHTWVARQSYRYLAAFQELTANNTFGGMVYQAETMGHGSLGMALKRDFNRNDAVYPWYIQPLGYELRVELVIT